MKCNRAEDQFSERFDNLLAPDAAEALQQHLAACPACHAGYESFAAAVGRLRSLGIAATPPAYAAQVSAAVFAERAPIGFVPRRAWRGPTLLILSHAAALLLGWGLVHFARRSQTGDSKSDELVHVDPPAPVFIEVPVEKRVEVRVEVPVEVIKQVIVEHTEYVDRPVPNPLQLGLDQQQALVVEFAASLREALLLARVASQWATRAASLPTEPQTPAAELVAAAPATINPTRAPMVVLREDGHVRIRTCGAAAEVVPSLIAALDDSDREVSAAAEQHLSSIRSRLAQEEGGAQDSPSPSIAASHIESGGIRGWWSTVSGAAREEPAPQATARERWQEWWNGRSLARADSSAH